MKWADLAGKFALGGALAGVFMLGAAFAVGVRAWRAHRAMWHDEGMWIPAGQTLTPDEIISYAAQLPVTEVGEIAERLNSWLPDDLFRQVIDARLRRLR